MLSVVIHICTYICSSSCNVLEKKNKPLGKPLQGEELARVQERFQRIREQDRIEREERQRRIEELNRETQRQLDELGISPGESSDEED